MFKNSKKIKVIESYDLTTRVLIGLATICAFTIVIANVVMSIA